MTIDLKHPELGKGIFTIHAVTTVLGPQVVVRFSFIVLKADKNHRVEKFHAQMIETIPVIPGSIPNNLYVFTAERQISD